MKKIYVFQCKGNDKIIGFSVEPTGKSLPLKFCGGGWRSVQEADISAESSGILGQSAIDILNGIELNGYHVAGFDENFTENS